MARRSQLAGCCCCWVLFTGRPGPKFGFSAPQTCMCMLSKTTVRPSAESCSRSGMHGNRRCQIAQNAFGWRRPSPQSPAVAFHDRLSHASCPALPAQRRGLQRPVARARLAARRDRPTNRLDSRPKHQRRSWKPKQSESDPDICGGGRGGTRRREHAHREHSRRESATRGTAAAPRLPPKGCALVNAGKWASQTHAQRCRPRAPASAHRGAARAECPRSLESAAWPAPPRLASNDAMWLVPTGGRVGAQAGGRRPRHCGLRHRLGRRGKQGEPAGTPLPLDSARTPMPASSAVLVSTNFCTEVVPRSLLAGNLGL